MFRRYILGFSIFVLSACGTTGKTQQFALDLRSNQSSKVISDVRVEAVAIDNKESYLNAINVHPWGEFDALDLENINQSLRDTLSRNLPDESSTFESKINIYLFIRRYVVSISNTGGAVLATATNISATMNMNIIISKYTTKFLMEKAFLRRRKSKI